MYFTLITMTMNVSVLSFLWIYIGGLSIDCFRMEIWQFFWLYEKELINEIKIYVIYACLWIVLAILYFFCIRYQLKKQMQFEGVYKNLISVNFEHGVLRPIIRKLDYSVGLYLLAEVLRNCGLDMIYNNNWMFNPRLKNKNPIYGYFSRKHTGYTYILMNIFLIVGIISAYFMNLKGKTRKIYSISGLFIFVMTIVGLSLILERLPEIRHQKTITFEKFTLLVVCFANLFVYASLKFFAVNSLFKGGRIVRDEKQAAFICFVLIEASCRLFRES